MTASFEPFFLDAGPGRNGQRFCIHHPPAGHAARGAVVYVHPFAEEMNKSRRMAALGSRALADSGFAVLQIDLLGCGDSSGDFGDATWADWVQDVVLAAEWMRRRYATPLWLWGLRAGCLLAVEAGARLEPGYRYLFWQPAASGKAVLQQFLRLEVAANLQQPNARGSTESLRQALVGGQSIEVAGYLMGPGLATGLERASLKHNGPATTVAWLEVSSRADADLLPASARHVESFRGDGWTVLDEVVPGPAFWQTQEIEDAPSLINATVAVVTGSTEKVQP